MINNLLSVATLENVFVMRVRMSVLHAGSLVWVALEVVSDTAGVHKIKFEHFPYDLVLAKKKQGVETDYITFELDFLQPSEVADSI